MSPTIDYGIDLGTTNSLIARCAGGKVSVLKNPRGLRELLPSVVSYRKGKIVVGDNARAYIEKSPRDVFGSFKRKMGTNEVYAVESLQRAVTPVELSAEVLRELRSIASENTGEIVDEAVVTVPAAFDVVQSAATTQAGLKAGFRRVVLLQEPVAASLAFVNQTRMDGDPQRRWLVYDLGGGTFDVALVGFHQGQMRVFDHEGDNYLGGRDFDELILNRMVLPRLMEATGCLDLDQMQSAASPHNSLYYRLLHLIEEAKAELSFTHTAVVEIEAEVRGTPFAVTVDLSRAHFESLIRPLVDRTIAMIRTMLARNHLAAADIACILMVGGATYTPLVRSRVSDQLRIRTAFEVDPTNAIAVGAAYYAGTVARSPAPAAEGKAAQATATMVRLSHARATRNDTEELMAKMDGDAAAFYRIRRMDGGFDTGVKPVGTHIHETLPLIKDQVNIFALEAYDRARQPLPLTESEIRIAQGIHEAEGQPLTHDICLEVDDPMLERTRLEQIFAKNSTLPLKRTVVRIATRTLNKGSSDCIHIKVYEGDAAHLPEASRSIGEIVISGEHLERFLIKGSDIELTFEMNPSRELSVSAWLQMTEQQFSKVFEAKERAVDIETLVPELEKLRSSLDLKIWTACEEDQSDKAEQFMELKEDVVLLILEARRLTPDDVTDRKFQIEDRRKKLVCEMSRLAMENEFDLVREHFKGARSYALRLTEEHGTPQERKDLDALLTTLPHGTSSNAARLRSATKDLRAFSHRINWRLPEYHRWLFLDLSTREDFTDKTRALNVIERGMQIVDADNMDQLRAYNVTLMGLLPDENKLHLEKKAQVGIG